MNRNELIRSKEYWVTQIQLRLFSMIEKYMQSENLNKTQLALKLGVSKGYISQILNGDFDHKLSKLVELSLMCEQVPEFNFKDIECFIGDEILNNSMVSYGSMHHKSNKSNHTILQIKPKVEIGDYYEHS
ncbi:MAG: helix-turn-helix transcriptional regulator [Bacteroidota bacterium]